MVKFLKVFALILLLINFWTFPTWAQSYQVDAQSNIPSVESGGVTYPDWEHLTFSDLGSVSESGGLILDEVDLTDVTSTELINYLGYDPSRTWEAGDHISSILKLGDFSDVSNVSSWNLNTIQNLTGLDLGGLRLSDFGALTGQSVEDLVISIPQLGLSALGDVSPVFDAVSDLIGVRRALKLADIPIADLGDALSIDNLSWGLGDISFNALDLSKYSLDSVPGLSGTPIGAFAGWAGLPIDQIPGLQYVPLAKMIGNLFNGGFLGKVDIVFGNKESNRTRTVSGSDQEGFNVPCPKNCAHIELVDTISLVTPVLRGKQWISGKSQKVKGGSGILKFVNGGKEPTGRHPFGEFFKVVLTNTDEKEGRADFGLYFRFCVKKLFISGCTPYFIGPVPWFSHKEGDLVFLGIDGITTDSVYGDAPSFPGIPSEVLADSRVQEILQQTSDDGQGNFTDQLVEPDSTITTDDCGEYKGISLGALKRAIAMKESGGGTNPNGDYYAVGPPAPLYDSKGNVRGFGNALGKYQYMTYREEVSALLNRDAQGKAILQKANQRLYKWQDKRLKEAIKQYFPPEKQDSLFLQDMKNLIDQAVSKGITNEGALLQQIATWHYQGSNSTYKTSSYSSQVYQFYQQQKSVVKASCGIQAGDGTLASCSKGSSISLIWPTTGIISDTFRFRGSHPVSGQPRMHRGTDIADAEGTPIKAAAAGQVTFAVSHCRVGQNCGYGGAGNWVEIQHCNGAITRYMHLQTGSTKVQKGQTIQQGQLIGNQGRTGGVTGTHLHFEYYPNGRNTAIPNTYGAIDPLKVLPKR